MMHADFHYRDKIAVAVLGQETEMGRQLTEKLTTHPWFILSDGSDPIGLTIDLSGHSQATPRIAEGIESVLVPEVNSLPLSEIPAVVGLPSAAAAALAIALQPLHEAFGLQAVRAVVMAGPGEAPNNAGPNPSLGARREREIRHLLHVAPDMRSSIDAIHLPLSQQTVQCVSVTLEQPTTCDALKQAWEREQNPLVALGLPSAVEKVVHVWDRPQGPPVSIGQHSSLHVQISRVQECPIFGFTFVVTSNICRVGALLLAELLVKAGKVYW